MRRDHLGVGSDHTHPGNIGGAPDYLKLRERCYGVTWNINLEGALEKSLGALDGSIDKWIEILQHIATFSIDGSKFLTGLQTFLVGPSNNQKLTQLTCLLLLGRGLAPVMFPRALQPGK